MRPQGLLPRILSVTLPVGGSVLVIFEGYFDESGDMEVPPGIFCVSGYFLSSEAAIAMDREWEAVLNAHSIPYFHMVECAHEPPAGVFVGKGKEERSEIVRKFIEIIKRHTVAGVSVFTHGEHFQVSDEHPNAYTECAEACINAIRTFMELSRMGGDIACFFESGHRSKNRIYSVLGEKLKKIGATVTFGEKEKIRLLQCADLLAWQSTKYWKDREAKARPPRKDFLSLVEHSHEFYLMPPRPK